MSLADTIITALEDTKNDNFDKLRKKLQNSKALPKQDFSKLIKILEVRAIEILSAEDLTMNECKLIGKALMASKLRNINDIIQHVISQDNKHTPIFLYNLLNKNCKIDCEALQTYIVNMIKREMHLCHYKVLLTISKNYSFLICSDVIQFCEVDSHPISKEILKRQSTRI